MRELYSLTIVSPLLWYENYTLRMIYVKLLDGAHLRALLLGLSLALPL